MQIYEDSAVAIKQILIDNNLFNLLLGNPEWKNSSASVRVGIEFQLFDLTTTGHVIS